MKYSLFSGLFGVYFDDLIMDGDSYFHKLARRKNKRFQIEKHKSRVFVQRRFLILGVNSFVQKNQTLYQTNIECLPLKAPYSGFISMIMNLHCLSNMRKYSLFEISKLSQVNFRRYFSKRPILIGRLKKAVKFAVLSDLTEDYGGGKQMFQCYWILSLIFREKPRPKHSARSHHVSYKSTRNAATIQFNSYNSNKIVSP